MPRISLGMMATPRPARTQRIVASKELTTAR